MNGNEENSEERAEAPMMEDSDESLAAETLSNDIEQATLYLQRTTNRFLNRGESVPLSIQSSNASSEDTAITRTLAKITEFLRSKRTNVERTVPSLQENNLSIVAANTVPSTQNSTEPFGWSNCILASTNYRLLAPPTGVRLDANLLCVIQSIRLFRIANIPRGRNINPLVFGRVSEANLALFFGEAINRSHGRSRSINRVNNDLASLTQRTSRPATLTNRNGRVGSRPGTRSVQTQTDDHPSYPVLQTALEPDVEPKSGSDEE